MLGRRVDAADGVESSAEGLDLLPISTMLEREKQTNDTVMTFGEMPAPWSWLNEQQVRGYEIHHGVTAPAESLSLSDGRLYFGDGNVLGIYFHGLFENASVLHALTGQRGGDREAAFNLLADTLEQSVDTAFLRSLTLAALDPTSRVR
jgi:adenosylcobyric acid synthase